MDPGRRLWEAGCNASCLEHATGLPDGLGSDVCEVEEAPAPDAVWKKPWGDAVAPANLQRPSPGPEVPVPLSFSMTHYLG